MVTDINLIKNMDSKSPIAEAYRMIRTNIVFSGIGKKIKTVMVSSCLPNEGKSTTIANLANVMAQSGNKVVLVDCDLRNPTQHKLFGVANKGVSNWGIGAASLDELLIASGVENLDLLPAGPVAPNPAELIASEVMQNLLKELKSRYDYVLVDVPPVMPVTDASLMASMVDGVVIVIASNEDKPAVVQEMKKRLELANAHVLGVVLNKVEISEAKEYGYGYYYGSE